MNSKDISKLKKLGFDTDEAGSIYSLHFGNVTIEEYWKQPGLFEIRLFYGNKQNHTGRIPKDSLFDFIRDNINELNKFDEKPNAQLSSKIITEAKKLEKPISFKNMWIRFNYGRPDNATLGILYSVNQKEYEPLCKKVNSLVSKAFKTIKIAEHGWFKKDCTFRHYQPLEKLMKKSLDIPYINKFYKDELEDFKKNGEENLIKEMKPWDRGLGIDTFVFKGKYKGVGTEASLYYFLVVIGYWVVEDVDNPTTAVEVITPINKGEDFFINEVKKAMSKLDVWKFNGKKIYINKCSKSVTGSAEKVFAYKGETITAGTKQEAIAQIVAGAENNFVTRLKKLGFHISCCIDKCDGLDYGISGNVSVYFKNKYAYADISIRTGEDDYKYFKNIPSEKVVDWCEKNHNLLDAYEKWGEPKVAEKMKVSLSKIK